MQLLIWYTHDPTDIEISQLYSNVFNFIMSKPVRQDYIAKVRYINNLPPPPLNPKMIEYNVTNPIPFLTKANQLMSSLFRKENFKTFISAVDEESGMNLNLLNNTDVLESGDNRAIHSLVKDDVEVKLHEKDRALLRDAGITYLAKSEPGVSFLRRTEYISEKQAPKSTQTNGTSTTKEEKLDPEAQLKAVEDTFEQAQATLDDFAKLKHPRKKNAKAVAAWPLLPDASMMDSKYLTVKFSGSASLSREHETLKRQGKYDEKLEHKSLLSTVYRPITSADGEWISLYQVRDATQANALVEKLQSTEKERPVNLLDEEEQRETYTLKHMKNYDMNFQRFSKPFEELSIKFAGDSGLKKRKAAYYYPVTGRIDLKKHRASGNPELNKFLAQSTFDTIQLHIREPTTNEIRKMDVARSEFDPMEYEGEDDEVPQENESEPEQPTEA